MKRSADFSRIYNNAALFQYFNNTSRAVFLYFHSFRKFLHREIFSDFRGNIFSVIRITFQLNHIDQINRNPLVSVRAFLPVAAPSVEHSVFIHFEKGGEDR